jgi:tripartite-type tricarboxylate transporter receptor subunit TctC
MFTRVKLSPFLFALAACALSMLASGGVLAAYPDRIIKIVVPFAPGGGTDVVARTLAQEMAKDLGVSVIIENKPGAGTIIGTQAVAASEGDGYTLLMGTFANAVNPGLYARLRTTSTAISPPSHWWRAPSAWSWSIRNRRSSRSGI